MESKSTHFSPLVRDRIVQRVRPQIPESYIEAVLAGDGPCTCQFVDLARHGQAYVYGVDFGGGNADGELCSLFLVTSCLGLVWRMPEASSITLSMREAVAQSLACRSP